MGAMRVVLAVLFIATPVLAQVPNDLCVSNSRFSR